MLAPWKKSYDQPKHHIKKQRHSVQFSHSVMSDSLRPHELQHTRPLCPSPTPRVHPNPCPLIQWCHSTISSSVVPYSSCPQSFPGSFPMSQLFAWGGQSIGVSASASVLPVNVQDWFPLGWTGWISLQSKALSRVFSNTTVQNHQFFWRSAFFTAQLSHPCMTTGKTIALTRWTFVDKVMSLPFNMLSRLVTTFLPRCKHLLISRQRHYLLTKVIIVKAMFFQVVMYACESWTIKKTEHQRIDVFELQCWRKLFRVPSTERRPNHQS